MNGPSASPARYQRNALAPGIIAAAVLFTTPIYLSADGFLYARYAIAILALIVAWFAAEARQWWWIPVFAAIAVAWNPVWPFEFDGPLWVAAQPAAAAAFLVAGALIRRPREG